MTPTRALDINARLVAAYVVKERITDGPLPDLSDVSLTEAIEASRIVSEMTGEANPERPGFKTFYTHVAPTRVHTLWFWAMAVAHEREVDDA